MKRICLDIDGVLADFVSHAGTLLGYDTAVVTTWDYYPLIGKTEDEFWRAIDGAGSDFWANMPAFPWFHELVGLCERHAPTILLSSPSRCPSSTHGKLRWIQSQFGSGFRKYLLGPAKEFCAAPGVVLIDDSDANCEKFEKHDGEAILFPQPWNENRILTADRIDYVSLHLAGL